MNYVADLLLPPTETERRVIIIVSDCQLALTLVNIITINLKKLTVRIVVVIKTSKISQL